MSQRVLSPAFGMMPRVIMLLAIITMTGCAAFTEHRVGVVGNQLTECPQWPRCVSSQTSQSKKHISPIIIKDDVTDSWRAARQAVSAMERSTIVEETDRYIRAEIISPWRVYTDDLELLLYPDEQLIHVRSSGRIGYYDFNVNRDRVESLRADIKSAQ